MHCDGSEDSAAEDAGAAAVGGSEGRGGRRGQSGGARGGRPAGRRAGRRALDERQEAAHSGPEGIATHSHTRTFVLILRTHPFGNSKLKSASAAPANTGEYGVAINNATGSVLSSKVAVKLSYHTVIVTGFDSDRASFVGELDFTYIFLLINSLTLIDYDFGCELYFLRNLEIRFC